MREILGAISHPFPVQRTGRRVTIFVPGPSLDSGDTAGGAKSALMEVISFLVRCFSYKISLHSHSPRNWLF